MKSFLIRCFYQCLPIILIVLFMGSGTAACAQENILSIRSNRYFDVTDHYTEQTGTQVNILRYEQDIMEEISAAFVTQNTDVDIFVFDAHEGLYYLKNKGYYFPLNSSQNLMRECANLYPAFRNALCDENGNLTAWVLYAQPFVRSEMEAVLNDLSISSPVTFEEFLDACHAIWQSDILGSEYSMMDIISYDQKDMLDFYMKLYLLSSYRLSGTVDYTNHHFLTTVERIQNELPRDPVLYSSGETIPTPIFCMMTAYETISAEMLPMPSVLENGDSAIECYMTVAVINPASNRKKEALTYLEYCAAWRDGATYFYNAAYDQPMLNPTVQKRMEELLRQEKKLKEINPQEQTPEQKEQLSVIAETLAEVEKNRMLVSPEDISHYAKMARALFVAEASPIQYDETLQRLASQYLNGIIDLSAFSSGCQRHVDLIAQELAALNE